MAKNFLTLLKIMKVKETDIADLLVFEPTSHSDERGSFFESYNELFFSKHVNNEVRFVQDNQSKSSKGVLRGLHYQLQPKAQGKLVRVIKGRIFDVAVDIRKNSKNFGNSVSIILSEENKKQFWIPEGFAHGFLSLEDDTEVIYKTTNFYSPAHERTISWQDKSINMGK